MKKHFLFTVFCLSFFFSCTENVVPKPQGYLRLEYPIARYTTFESDCPFSFGINTLTQIKNKNNCSFNIEYSTMKATIYLSYKPINNNLENLLKDAQKLTYQHTKKAETIYEQPFENIENKVYGMLYRVGGEAASDTQFYLTDSIKNFIIGSVYFKVKPNSDSILPASEYIKNDVRLLIESFDWKN